MSLEKKKGKLMEWVVYVICQQKLFDGIWGFFLPVSQFDIDGINITTFVFLLFIRIIVLIINNI